MPTFSSLLGLTWTDPVTILPQLSMIPPVVGTPRTYKPCTLHKPSKTSGDQRWLLIWWQYSPTHGKVIRRRQGFDLNSLPLKADRERRASEWMGAINTLLKEGYLYGDTQPQPLVVQTWSSLWNLFLVTKSHLTSKGLETYAYSRSVWKEWESIHPTTPLTLTKAHQSPFHTFLTTFPRPRTGKPLSGVSRNRIWDDVKAWGKWMVGQGHLTPEQGKFFQLGKEKVPASTSHKPYTPSQLQAILTEAKGNPQLYLFLHLAYYTFARPRGELTSLRVEDIRDTTIWIRPETDKGRVGRYCLIPPPLEVLLREYGVRDYPGHLYLFTKKGVPGIRKVGPRYFYTHLLAILKKLGMDGQGHTLYGLKHSGNIALWSKTQDLDLLRRQNGHGSLSMTEKYLRSMGIVLDSTKMSQFPVMGMGT